MRYKLKSGFVLLVAVLALGAVGVSAASAALPEFSIGKERFPIKFQGKLNTAEWRLSNGSYECTGGYSIKGEVTAAKTVKNTKIIFRGCGGQVGTVKIKCPRGLHGEAEGEVITEALEGTPVYLSKSEKTVAIMFKAQTGTALAHFECMLDKAEVKGSFLVPITPVNKLAEFFTINSSGTEKYETEGGLKLNARLEDNFLNEGKFTAMSWQFKSEIETVNGGEQLEIKA
jgi:hypothetical protein